MYSERLPAAVGPPLERAHKIAVRAGGVDLGGQEGRRVLPARGNGAAVYRRKAV